MKTGTKIILLVIGMCILLYTQCSTDTYIGRWIKWRASDILDHQKFPKHHFSASKEPFYFIASPQSDFGLKEVTFRGQKKKRLQDIVPMSGTTAFLFIKNDSLLYEQYANGYDRASINTSFSTAKSITSLLVGKAIDDGYIESEEDRIIRYLPELKKVDPQYDQLQISHILDMRSGIQFKDHDLPWGDKPKAYYKPKLRDRIMELPMTAPPNSSFHYNSYNPILLGMLLENTTGQTPAAYFEHHIWNKLGMEYAGSWSMDSEGSGMTKMESGLNLMAIDFAKFGRLVLQKGQWNDQQLISEKWINESTAIDPDHKLNEFGDDLYYENFWWLHSKDGNTPYIISATGHLGQYLYIFPQKNIIIVRMGKKQGDVDSWTTIFKELSGY
ncbi:serine hydrolase domain-containing protein [Sediminicola sp. 1XM1-17]|uniref:serine hydrolase domain-containing protein n=1 Tax=Sediminicola sp. 1XM1-17 TaxID=3127702 RepID=UPI0030774469